jgi:hypothetical protein
MDEPWWKASLVFGGDKLPHSGKYSTWVLAGASSKAALFGDCGRTRSNAVSVSAVPAGLVSSLAGWPGTSVLGFPMTCLRHCDTRSRVLHSSRCTLIGWDRGVAARRRHDSRPGRQRYHNAALGDGEYFFRSDDRVAMDRDCVFDVLGVAASVGDHHRNVAGAGDAKDQFVALL